MGSKEFAVPVRGSGAEPLATTQAAAFEVDNYREAGKIEDDGTGYNVTVDPTETIQELIIFECGDIEMDITTESGTSVTGIPLRSSAFALNTVEIDSITFKDPDATGASLYGMWVGE